ncbi:MAG: putative peptidase [Prokaryotic dsDNA virus sp.]|nr:MAG: putative peptidase [Prokaryotic dsDNA virus sp.]|tara:strand:- start:10661 stop:11848 length:1188 start_codon:yes stop_codon:yes gene_type:complete
MRIIELILNENEKEAGIDAVSVVEAPAIESDFIALKKHQIELKTVDEEKRLLMGAALIPKKQIFRRNDKTNEEYYIYFSKETIRKASQLFLKKGNQNNATLEHNQKINGMTVVESWLVEDTKKDKSSLYGFNAVPGTWFITMKVENDNVWNKVKSGEIKGFSIEGYFAEKIEAKKQELKSLVIDDDIAIIDDRTAYNTEEKALAVAKDMGCEGAHMHEFEGKNWYMPCAKHIENSEVPTIDLKKPCWSGYEQIGFKMKDGKKVPNCVPIKKSTNLESYADYPKSVSNNAKRGIALNEKNNNKCATQTGKVRAQQLAQGEAISVSTIKRMYSYLSRAKTYYDKADPNDCGNISYLLWGGLSALRWSESKLKSLDKLEATKQERDKEILNEIKNLFK